MRTTCEIVADLKKWERACIRRTEDGLFGSVFSFTPLSARYEGIA